MAGEGLILDRDELLSYNCELSLYLPHEVEQGFPRIKYFQEHWVFSFDSTYFKVGHIELLHGSEGVRVHQVIVHDDALRVAHL